MESTSTSTSTKMDVIKPVLLKAGISLAIIVAGLFFAWIPTRNSNLKASTAESQTSSNGKQRGEGRFHDVESLDSSSLSCVDADNSSTDASEQNSEEKSHHQHIYDLEEEILVLRNRVEDLHAKELELETQYLHYHDVKEQELVLMEPQNKLLQEITRVEFLDKEISSLEAERQMFEKMVVEYLKIMELLEISRSENRLLQRRVKKLLRRTKDHSRALKENCMHIEAKEAEISRNCEELEAKANVIREMEGEIKQLKTTLEQLQTEKNELMSLIELANKPPSLKIDVKEADIVVGYGQVVSKLEQIEKEHAVEIKELIYLRWCNAYLRHELMRKNQEQQDLQQRKTQSELNFGEISDFVSDCEHDNSILEPGDSCLEFPTTGHARAQSKRRKFIEKFKRWVEGSEKTKQQFNEKGKHKIKYLLKHSVPDGSDDLHILIHRS